MAGKGSRPRPYSVNQKTFDSNWDRIFQGSKEEKKAIEELSKMIAEETLDETELKNKEN
jgi:hypothetical protein